MATNGFGDLGDVLTVDQPAAQQTLVNIFGSSLTAPTNPPPGANGLPQAPPLVTPTTTATTPSGSASSSKSGSAGGAPASTTTTTTVPPSFNPVPCTPS